MQLRADRTWFPRWPRRLYVEHACFKASQPHRFQLPQAHAPVRDRLRRLSALSAEPLTFCLPEGVNVHLNPGPWAAAAQSCSAPLHPFLANSNSSQHRRRSFRRAPYRPTQLSALYGSVFGKPKISNKRRTIARCASEERLGYFDNRSSVFAVARTRVFSESKSKGDPLGGDVEIVHSSSDTVPS